MHRLLAHTSIGPTIGTITGHYFNFLEPETSVITIDDIVAGLSKCCRFAGQCEGFYSVAQHSVLASYLVPEGHALEALFHDASEAYTGDISKPLKNLLGDAFVRIEKGIEKAIFQRFGLPYPMNPCIKVADRILLATEQRDLMAKLRDDEWASIHGVKPMVQRIHPMEHREAATLWLNRYRELTQEISLEMSLLEACG